MQQENVSLRLTSIISTYTVVFKFRSCFFFNNVLVLRARQIGQYFFHKITNSKLNFLFFKLKIKEHIMLKYDSEKTQNLQQEQNQLPNLFTGMRI